MPERSLEPVVIVGGGVMGCAVAWRLARARRPVVVLERSVPGAEASSAAAGILGAQVEAHCAGPMTELALASRARWPRFAADLGRATGIDVGYRQRGVLRVAFDARAVTRIARATAWQRRAGLDVERVQRRRARALEPALSDRVAGGALYPADAQLDPRLLLRALHIAAAGAGATFRSGAYVRRVVVTDDRAAGVALDDGSVLAASHVVVAAGSWTTLVEGLGLPGGAVQPARGQIVQLDSATPVLSRVVFGPRCYLVPREDGRTLCGSTLEFVGFRREVTASAVRELLDAAIELCPPLGSATFADAWANFRPFTEDELPLLGATAVRGLSLATGHYRNGILLAPITAEIVASIVCGRRPPLALAAFAPGRVAGPVGDRGRSDRVGP